MRTDIVTGLRFPEGNRWRQGRLWFADMHTGEVLSIDPDDETEPRLETTLPGQASGLGWLPDGRLIVSSMAERAIRVVEADGSNSVWADLSDVEPSYLNDMTSDEATGRTYIGAFGYDLYGGEALRPGPLHVVEPDGSSRLAADGLVFPNSASILPGTRTLVVSETWGGVLTAFDIERDGSLTGRRTWATLPEGVTPDGSTVDAESAIWVCSVDTGEFLRVREGGEITDRIAFEGRCAIDCALGGADGRTLYLSTADSYDPAVTATTRAGTITAVQVAVPRA